MATSEAETASKLAFSAFSPLCRTVLVSSLIAEAVSWSVLACCSVRADKCILLSDMRTASLLMASELVRNSDTILCRLLRIACIAVINLPSSSVLSVFMLCIKLPSAMKLANCTVLFNGRTMLPTIQIAPMLPSANANTERIICCVFAALRVRLFCAMTSMVSLPERVVISFTIWFNFWVGARSFPLTAASMAAGFVPSNCFSSFKYPSVSLLSSSCTSFASVVLRLSCSSSEMSCCISS